MRLCRFGEGRLGVVRGAEVLDVTDALDDLPSYRYPLPSVDQVIANLGTLRPRIEAVAETAEAFPLSGISLLSPVANPGKIVAAPVNYKKHLEEARTDPEIHHQNQIAEIQKVGLFLKATSSLEGPSKGVEIRHPERRNDHEIELAVIISKAADRISAEEALDYVAGYAIGLDMTIRGPEERSLRKSLDTFTVLGPWLVTADEIPDPNAISLKLSVNGETRQDANTRDLVIGVADLIAYASSFYTLMPGDILLTGTPEGVGPVVPGDVINATIEHVGTMDVQVRAAQAR
nr:fumarylacetoacetate hydrolase family protein [Rhizobium sp. P28RR-XV]